jgi:hypothetical protein
MGEFPFTIAGEWEFTQEDEVAATPGAVGEGATVEPLDRVSFAR